MKFYTFILLIVSLVLSGCFKKSAPQLETADSKNEILPTAVDGYKQTMSCANFNNLYKFALIGDLYDIKEVSTQDEDA